MPYYKFRSSKLHELSAWLALILKCLEKIQSFKIIFPNKLEYKFEGEEGKKNLVN